MTPTESKIKWHGVRAVDNGELDKGAVSAGAASEIVQAEIVVRKDPEEWEFDDGDDEPSDSGFNDCGLTSEGYCMYAGSEWCDFDCPVNR